MHRSNLCHAQDRNIVTAWPSEDDQAKFKVTSVKMGAQKYLCIERASGFGR
jgi:hypothetical protein